MWTNGVRFGVESCRKAPVNARSCVRPGCIGRRCRRYSPTRAHRGYQRRQRPREPKIDPYRDRIAEILEADKQVHHKQRHTAKRIWERLQEEGFAGGYTIVKDAV